MLSCFLKVLSFRRNFFSIFMEGNAQAEKENIPINSFQQGVLFDGKELVYLMGCSMSVVMKVVNQTQKIFEFCMWSCFLKVCSCLRNFFSIFMEGNAQAGKGNIPINNSQQDLLFGEVADESCPERGSLKEVADESCLKEELVYLMGCFGESISMLFVEDVFLNEHMVMKEVNQSQKIVDALIDLAKITNTCVAAKIFNDAGYYKAHYKELCKLRSESKNIESRKNKAKLLSSTHNVELAMFLFPFDEFFRQMLESGELVDSTTKGMTWLVLQTLINLNTANILLDDIIQNFLKGAEITTDQILATHKQEKKALSCYIEKTDRFINF